LKKTSLAGVFAALPISFLPAIALAQSVSAVPASIAASGAAPVPATSMTMPPTSSVTLYGRLDASVNYQAYSATATRPHQHAVTLSNDTSWWGFRGTEDLGGGNRAYFKMEGGFQIDTGGMSGTSLFNRETYLGLGNVNLGSIQAGSQFSPTIWMSVKVDPFLRQNAGANFTLLQAGPTGVPRGYAIQYQNAVQYISPVIWGFSGKALISAGEGSPNGPSYAAELEYSHGPLYVGMAYDQFKTAAGPVGVHTTTAPVLETNYTLGAAYDFHVVKIGGMVETNHIDGVPDMNAWMLGATIPVTSVSDVRTSFAHRSQSGASASLTALGYFYKLSKRTEVYTSAGHTNNSGSAAFGVWPVTPPNPDLGNTTGTGPLAPGRDVTSFQVGMRHYF
jgi:GBP family porin